MTKAPKDRGKTAQQPAQSLCPLCHQDNHCGMLMGDSDSANTCWCFEQPIPEAAKQAAVGLVGQVEAAKRCICQSCAREYLKPN